MTQSDNIKHRVLKQGKIIINLGVGSNIRYLINQIAQRQQAEILQMNTERNAGLFDNEMGKLDRWAEDVKNSIEQTGLFTIRWKVI